jgi:hypothetical protein
VTQRPSVIHLSWRSEDHGSRRCAGRARREPRAAGTSDAVARPRYSATIPEPTAEERMHTSRLARLCAAVLGCALLWAQEKPKSHLLQCAFQVGHSQFFRITMSSEAKGVSVHDITNMAIELITEERVVGVNDGKADLEVTVRRVVVHSSGRERIDYDSDDPRSDPGAHPEFAAIVGATLKAKMDQCGHVSDWKVPDHVQCVSLQTQGAFGPIVEFPDHPVAVGEAWETPYGFTSSVSVKSGGKEDSSANVARMRNTLAAVESGKAIVKRETCEQPKESDGLRTRASTTGRCTVDFATGQTFDAEEKTVVSVSIGNGEMQVTSATRRQAIADPGKRPVGK